MKRYALIGVLLSIVLITHAPLIIGKNAQEVITLAFESPFGTSWYKKSIDSSMRLWGDLDALLEIKESKNNEENLLLLHSILGQLVYVHYCVEQLDKDKKVPLYADDSAYLGTIIHHLSTIAGRVSQKFSYECTQCFAPLIEQIRRTLDQIPHAK